jgi:hypothetical protein
VEAAELHGTTAHGRGCAVVPSTCTPHKLFVVWSCLKGVGLRPGFRGIFRKTRKRGRFLAENDPQGVLPQGKGWCLTRDLGQVSNYRNRTFGGCSERVERSYSLFQRKLSRSTLFMRARNLLQHTSHGRR